MCSECKRQFSATSETRYRAHKISVGTIQKIESMAGKSSIRQIAKETGVNYRTAWARLRKYEDDLGHALTTRDPAGLCGEEIGEDNEHS